MSEFVLSVEDVYNVVQEHMAALDKLWPDHEMHGPRKVTVVELIDGIKLRLLQLAEKNQNRYESPFEKAARRITGTPKPVASRDDVNPDASVSKTAMQLAHEQAQARMRKST